jgi:hypothetical protein
MHKQRGKPIARGNSTMVAICKSDSMARQSDSIALRRKHEVTALSIAGVVRQAEWHDP